MANASSNAALLPQSEPASESKRILLKKIGLK